MGVQYSNRVFIGNLHTRMSEYDVCWILRQYCYYPEDIKVIRDINGCSKGYCFVDFRKEEEAKGLLAHDEIVSKYGRKLLIKPAVRVQRKEVLVIKKQLTANASPSSSASSSARETPTSGICEHSGTGGSAPYWRSTVPSVSRSLDSVSRTGLLSERGLNKLQLNLPSEAVEQSNLVPAMQMWSPFSVQPVYYLPSLPSTPLNPANFSSNFTTPIQSPYGYSAQSPFGGVPSSPFYPLQYFNSYSPTTYYPYSPATPTSQTFNQLRSPAKQFLPGCQTASLPGCQTASLPSNLPSTVCQAGSALLLSHEHSGE